MRILLANDDGIAAEGLVTLARVLAEKHEVYACAPDRERSSASHSVTYWRLDNTAERVNVPGAKEAWKISGTPADCVFYGLNTFFAGKIDLVISGINNGENMSTDVVYSGTIGAAEEGLMMGVPAMAVSLCRYSPEFYETAAEIAAELIPLYMKQKNRLKYVCSLNIPDLPREEIKGIRITQFDGFKDFSKAVIQKPCEDGRVILTCPNAAPVLKNMMHSEKGDLEAVKAGYVSVTPIGMNYSIQMDEIDEEEWTGFSL